MGFDEVSKQWREDGVCKNGPLSFLVLNAYPFCRNLNLLLAILYSHPCIGVHDKPEEAEGPPRSNDEGFIWAEDRM